MNPSELNDSPLVNNSSRLAAGTLLADRYVVLERIGAGGCGEVYKVRSVDLNRICAAKVLAADQVAEVELRRFQQEAQILSRLKHPNIVSVDALVMDKNFGLVLVMEYLGGTTLSQLKDTLPLEEKMRLFSQVCDGLSFVHSNNILHRDIKPSNVIVSDGRAVLIDFGISKNQNDIKKLTATNMFLGTPGYMSPEYCRGESVDQRSDVYAMGCLLFELISGSPPYDGETPLSVMSQHITATTPEISGTAAMERFNPVIARCLAKAPSERYENIADLKSDLEKAASGERVVPYMVSRSKRKRKISLLVPALCTACVVLGGLLLFGAQIVRTDKSPSLAEREPQTTGKYLEKIQKAIEEKDLVKTKALVEGFCSFVPTLSMEVVRKNFVMYQAWLCYARALSAAGRLPEADSAFRKSAHYYREARESKYPPLDQLAQMWIGAGRYDLARKVLDDLSHERPPTYEDVVQVRLASIDAVGGKFDEAEKALVRVTQLVDSEYTHEAKVMLADISYRRGEFRKCIDRYQDCLIHSNLDSWNLAKLAVAYHHMGQTKDAQTFKQQVLERMQSKHKSAQHEARAPFEILPNNEAEFHRFFAEHGM